MWEVDIGIPVDAAISPTTSLGTDVFELQRKIESAIGRQSHSSGTGFGYRDFQCPFDTKEAAKKASDIAAKILREAGFEVKLNESYDEDWTGAYVAHYEPKEVIEE